MLSPSHIGQYDQTDLLVSPTTVLPSLLIYPTAAGATTTQKHHVSAIIYAHPLRTASRGRTCGRGLLPVLRGLPTELSDGHKTGMEAGSPLPWC